MGRIFQCLLLLLICAKIGAEENKTVLFSILARNVGHVLPRFLSCLENQEYDKKLISVYINTNNNDDNTLEILSEWAKKNRSLYRHIEFESHDVANMPVTKQHEWPFERLKIMGQIRQKSLAKTKELKCDYYFVTDCDNFIAPCTLKELVKKDKPIISPLIPCIPELGDVAVNYFCKTSDAGYYMHDDDYWKIMFHQKIGTFKVDLVHCTYLIKADYIDKLTYADGTNDFEFVIFSRSAKKNGVDQYICNEKYFGQQLNFAQKFALKEEHDRVKELFSKDIRSIDLSLAEKRFYSQNGEDGIFDALCAFIGLNTHAMHTMYYVGLGAHSGRECNISFLRAHRGWSGLLLGPITEDPAINLKKEPITKENVNALFEKYAVPHDFALLSITLNNNEFHIWNALDRKYRPSIVAVQYNANHLPTEDKVAPYDPVGAQNLGSNPSGASILSLYQLGQKKGYSLIYVDNSGTNLFFLKNELVEKLKTLKATFKDVNNVAALYKSPKNVVPGVSIEKEIVYAKASELMK